MLLFLFTSVYMLFWLTSMFVPFCLSVCSFIVVYQYYMLLFWLMNMFLLLFTSVFVVFLAYEYVCCLFSLTVNVFCYFCLPVNFAITERESHHVMVVSENETWSWKRRIVTMPLPSGF